MKALVLLGCPEAPSQTPIGLYASYKLGQMGYDVTVSSNPAAGKILDISDPEGVYVKKRVDIEKCLDEIEEGDYDLLVGCVHKDAAATFFITYYHVLKCKALAIVFSRDGDMVWQCANCGHIHKGKHAPGMCPVCEHPQAYFQEVAKNY